MSVRLNIAGVNVLENPARIDQPFKIEIIVEALEHLKEGVEFELAFVASDGKEERDHVLGCHGIGAIHDGRHTFNFDVPASYAGKLSAKDLKDMKKLLLNCKYRKQTFAEIWFSVEHKKKQRFITPGFRITTHAIKWDDDLPAEDNDEKVPESVDERRNGIVDHQMKSLKLYCKEIKKAAIIGVADASVWARTEGDNEFRATEAELKKLVSLFNLDIVPTVGANLEGVHYDVSMAEENLIYGEKEKTGFFAAKTNSAVLIAVFEDEGSENEVRDAVKNFAASLRVIGY